MVTICLNLLDLLLWLSVMRCRAPVDLVVGYSYTGRHAIGSSRVICTSSSIACLLPQELLIIIR